MKTTPFSALLILSTLLFTACGDDNPTAGSQTPPPADLKPLVATKPIKKQVSVTGKIAKGWKVIYTSSHMESAGEGPKNAIDENPRTIWHSQWRPKTPKHPHELHLDLAVEQEIFGFTYLPRQNGVNGTVKDYELYISNDPEKWGSPVSSGAFENARYDFGLKIVPFKEAVKGRYLRFVAKSEINGKPWTSVAELNIIIEK